MHPELARAVLLREGEVSLTVRGGSMGPWLRSGDTVRVVPVTCPRVGELLAFARRDQVITHRVIAKRDDGVVTRGDASPSDDGVVLDAEILGRVTGLHVRWLRLERVPRPVAALVGRALGGVARCALPVRTWLVASR